MALKKIDLYNSFLDFRKDTPKTMPVFLIILRNAPFAVGYITKDMENGIAGGEHEYCGFNEP